MNVRVACARVLSDVLRRHRSLDSSLSEFVDKVPARDAGLLRELCYGTLRHFPALEIIAGKMLTKPLKSKDSDIRALILAGLYQLRELRTPAHAAVNESVAACRALKKAWAGGVVNSVLRRYLREREQIDRDCGAESAFRSLHPLWLEKMLVEAWEERAGEIMAANNRRPPMTLRVNRLRTSRDSYLDRLADAGIAARPAPFSGAAIYLDTACDVAELPGFAGGSVSVQDEAAQLCTDVLDLHPGQRVLDSCSAPGGKTCHILEHEPALAELVALDVDGDRLARVAENLDRLNLSASLKAADASRVTDWWDGKPFDRILLDAPCSATGVIRRHPDIKVLRRPEDIDKLAATQRRLLESLWSVLKPGGKLLYATCSVLPEENDRVIGSFVDGRTNCRPVTIDRPWGLATPWGKQLFPQPDGHDGFYYALLLKLPAAPGNRPT